MASIRTKYGRLVVDFYYMGKRCRETTNLIDTPANRVQTMKITLIEPVFLYGLSFAF